MSFAEDEGHDLPPDQSLDEKWDFLVSDEPRETRTLKGFGLTGIKVNEPISDAKAMEILRVKGWRTHAERTVLAAVLAEVARQDAGAVGDYADNGYALRDDAVSDAAFAIREALRLSTEGA